MTDQRPSRHLLIATESGATYHLDLHDWTVRREGGRGSSVLRRDGQAVRVVALREVAVGEPWWLLLDLGLESGALTVRATTRVTAVEPEDVDCPLGD